MLLPKSCKGADFSKSSGVAANWLKSRPQKIRASQSFKGNYENVETFEA